MKVTVVGGSGITGTVSVLDLLENKNVEQVQVVDLVERHFSDPRVVFKKIDVQKHDELAKAIKGHDVVINASQYYFNLDVMDACLIAKVPYIDFGGLYHMTRQQVNLNDKFAKEGLLAVIGMGAQPGISSVAASYAVNKMDKAESVIIRDAWMDKTEGAKYYFSWSPATLIDELTLPAVHYQDSKFMETAPMSRSEPFNFGPEIGDVTVYRTLHSEIATMPESFKEKGVKYVEWMEGSRDILNMKMIVDMGFGMKEKYKVDGTEIVPRDFFIKFLKSQGILTPPDNLQVKDYERTVVEVNGEEGGKSRNVQVIIDFKYDEKRKLSASQKEVGVPGSIVAQMIAGGIVKGKGVKPPEQIIPPKLFFPELAKRDIRVRSRETSDIS